MAARSLNKVILIGNLTRDPELRYTPNGTAVCTFGLATNRTWVTQTGETKEDTEFHRIVAWNKLADLCAQLLAKGKKAYVEGRLSTHVWTGQDGVQRTTTEIVIEDMIVLDSRRIMKEETAGPAVNQTTESKQVPEAVSPAEPAVPTVSSSDASIAGSVSTASNIPAASADSSKKGKKINKKKEQEDKQEKNQADDKVNSTGDVITPDDIPF